MNYATTEMEIKVLNGRITGAKVSGGLCKITVEMNIASSGEEFVLCEASKLSLDDKIMRHKPCSNEEKVFKKFLKEAIESGVKDFYRPKFDPSLDENGRICYVANATPAVGKSYNWWEENAKRFCPERKSRLGTNREYIVFLGTLIKQLSDNGWSVAKAWRAVCNDSKELGHYRNSVNAKYELEPTGSREVCGYCDLGNTYKILAESNEAGGFWLAGGCYYDNFGSDDYPLADLDRDGDCNDDFDCSVGWLVLEK